MKPNVRKGLRRVAVVYFTLCALVGLYGWYLYEISNDGWLEASRANASAPEMRYWTKLSVTAIDFLEAAFLLGVFLPIFAAILGGIGLWIYRGFKPKAEA